MWQWCRWRFCDSWIAAGSRWSSDDCSHLAAAVSYYAALSLYPLLIILIAGLGIFLGFTSSVQDAEKELLEELANHGSPVLEQQIAAILEQVRDSSYITGPMGLVTLLFTAILTFAEFEWALKRIWNVTDHLSHGWFGAIRFVLFGRFRAFLMLVGLGLILCAILVTSIVLSAIDSTVTNRVYAGQLIWEWLQPLVSISINAAVFTCIYKWIPRAPVAWRDAWAGGVVSSIVWEIGRQVLATFLIANKYTSAYGVVGSFIAIMLWIYYAFSVIFFGAEYVVVSRDHRHHLRSEREAAERASSLSDDPLPSDIVPPT